MEGDFNHRITCQFKFTCPMVWGLLSPTDQIKVRFCGECQREVFICVSEGELDFHVKRGHCVAIPVNDTETSEELPGTYVIGEPEASY